MLDGTVAVRADTQAQDPALAVADIAVQIGARIPDEDLAGVIFFCCADYPPAPLARALGGRFRCPLIGCTSAGEVGNRYQEGGIVALGLSSRAFRLHSALIDPISGFDSDQSEKLAWELRQGLQPSAGAWNTMGLLLIDGLSLREEQVIAMLHRAMGDTPIIGGSAGDGMRFQQTRIYAEGAFRQGAAVFCLIESILPFSTFREQHFVPSNRDMVITEADPERRIVYEIDGSPAAEEYARVINLPREQLTTHELSKHPTKLEIGNEWYIRSIMTVNPNGSITFACAIDTGLTLTIALGIGLVQSLRRQVERIEEQFVDIAFTLGCDCLFRRLEIVDKGLQVEVETLLRRLRFIGFNTYGEQFNSIHVNQTLTAVVFGSRRSA
jgi:hypothetical protein